MISISKSIDVDMAHNVAGHLGPCINIHGHTWKMEVEWGCSNDNLDELGMVADFGDLKSSVLKPTHELLDHAYAMGEEVYQAMRDDLKGIGITMHNTRSQQQEPCMREGFELNGARLEYPGGIKIAVFPFSPTSELLAYWLGGLSNNVLAALELGPRVRTLRASVYETLHPVEAVAHWRP